MPVNPQQEAAARQLIALREKGSHVHRLPEELRPRTVEEGLEVQRLFTALWGKPVGAWKCSLPKPDRLIAAPIYSHTIFRTSPCPVMPVPPGLAPVEPEIAFRLGRDLPPRLAPYQDVEILDCVEAAFLALELIGTRYSDPDAATFPEMLADHLSNAGLFVGPDVDVPPREIPREFSIEVTGAQGIVVRRDGRHPDADPVAPLLWLANFLSREGNGLMAGQVVITGSYAGVLELPLDTSLEIHYGELGVLPVSFQAMKVEASSATKAKLQE